MGDRSLNSELAPLLVAACFALVLVGGVGYWPSVRLQYCPTIRIASSFEKYGLLSELAASFSANATSNLGCNDPLVSVEKVSSGQAEAELAGGWGGPGRPDVWAPAATTWVQLLRSRRPGLVAATRLYSIAQSPLVVAMPMKMAEALGWPSTQPSWRQLLALANDPRGWAAHGHPEWGRFLLGKTDPTSSTSGLHGLLAEFYVASGKPGNLSPSDVASGIPFVHDVELSVSHYADTVETCLYNLAQADRSDRPYSYVSALPVEEQEVAAYNRGDFNDGLPPVSALAAVYPSDFTLVADHPYVPLAWATPAQRGVADRFLQWLLQPEQQAQFAQNGLFRNYDGAAGSKLALIPGILAAQPALLAYHEPDPAALARIEAAWSTIRKRARILVLLDLTTSSQRGLVLSATRALAKGDAVAVWDVAESGARQPYVPLLGVTEVGDDGEATAGDAILDARLHSRSDQLYGATLSAYEYLANNLDAIRVNAIVVVAGAPDDGRGDNLLLLLEALETGQVHVYTVAVNPDLAGPLRRMSRASTGVYLTSSNDAIRRALADF